MKTIELKGCLVLSVFAIFLAAVVVACYMYFMDHLFQ